MPLENHASPGVTAPTTLAVLLAAGAGSRFQDIGHNVGHKLLASLDDQGTTILERSLSHLIEADLGDIAIVTGALARPDLASVPSVAALLEHPSVRTIHNDRWADGQSTSVRIGVDAARAAGADAVVIGLADQPFVPASAWQTVAAGLGPITVATYDGRRGNPVRLHADVWDRLPRDGDIGARDLMRRHPELVTEVSCNGSPADIDTLEDLHRWQSN